MSGARAIVFDLDETLYAERRFVLSGFAAVARTVGGGDEAATARVFRTLARAFRAGNRATAFQRLCEAEGWPPARVPEFIELLRNHTPTLRLPRATAETLRRLRRGWRLGILTNGLPEVQARKVAALGVEALVDAVVYAAQHGTGRGKPDREAFDEIAARLRVPHERCVFVGDDPRCDVEGARAAGMLTIRIQRGPHARTVPPVEADVVAPRVEAVPFLAACLLGESDTLCA
jgi:putative hydrolase of the HAD superfamily